MFLKLFFTIILIKQGHLWSIGNLCPAETQHRYFNRNHGLIQLYCNSKGNYSQINEILDLNELELTELEELEHFYDYGFTITVQVEKKILTKVITKYNETRSQINIPEELEEITFFNNQIDRIENDFFSGLSILYKLGLNQNNLRGVEPFSFKNLESLILLELMSNKLTKIENNTFIGLSCSEGKLLLESNDISILEFDAFKGLGFKEINLNNNNLKIIRKGVFSQAFNLEVLYLESNQITEIESNSFIENERLTTVWLEFNKIKFIHLNLFNKNLIKLRLNTNYLSNLDSETFADESELVELYITDMKLQLIDFKLNKFSKLEKLDISNNYVIQIKQNSFSGLPSLKRFNLSHNYLDALADSRFQE